MRRVWTPLLLVALMLTMPWATSLPAPPTSPLESPLWTAAEAAENWYESAGSPGPTVAISSGSGKIWVQTGGFDPLLEQSQ